MTESYIEIPKPVDPHLRRWMLFVDGENFTIRAQKLAKDKSLKLDEGDFYSPDIFVWIPGTKPTQNMIDSAPIKAQPFAIRAYFYTSVVGDQQKLINIRRALHSLGFAPEVFKKDKKEEKAKGVDIALARDFLGHAFQNNYDVAVLVAGDGDYVPLVQEVKRLGKTVYLEFFKNYGLNEELYLASDSYFEMEQFFVDQWQKKAAGKI